MNKLKFKTKSIIAFICILFGGTNGSSVGDVTLEFDFKVDPRPAGCYYCALVNEKEELAKQIRSLKVRAVNSPGADTQSPGSATSGSTFLFSPPGRTSSAVGGRATDAIAKATGSESPLGLEIDGPSRSGNTQLPGMVEGIGDKESPKSLKKAKVKGIVVRTEEKTLPVTPVKQVNLGLANDGQVEEIVSKFEDRQLGSEVKSGEAVGERGTAEKTPQPVAAGQPTGGHPKVETSETKGKGKGKLPPRPPKGDAKANAATAGQVETLMDTIRETKRLKAAANPVSTSSELIPFQRKALEIPEPFEVVVDIKKGTTTDTKVIEESDLFSKDARKTLAQKLGECNNQMQADIYLGSSKKTIIEELYFMNLGQDQRGQILAFIKNYDKYSQTVELFTYELISELGLDAGFKELLVKVFKPLNKAQFKPAEKPADKGPTEKKALVKVVKVAEEVVEVKVDESSFELDESDEAKQNRFQSARKNIGAAFLKRFPQTEVAATKKRKSPIEVIGEGLENLEKNPTKDNLDKLKNKLREAFKSTTINKEDLDEAIVRLRKIEETIEKQSKTKTKEEKPKEAKAISIEPLISNLKEQVKALESKLDKLKSACNELIESPNKTKFNEFEKLLFLNGQSIPLKVFLGGTEIDKLKGIWESLQSTEKTVSKKAFKQITQTQGEGASQKAIQDFVSSVKLDPLHVIILPTIHNQGAECTLTTYTKTKVQINQKTVVPKNLEDIKSPLRKTGDSYTFPQISSSGVSDYLRWLVSDDSHYKGEHSLNKNPPAFFQSVQIDGVTATLNANENKVKLIIQEMCTCDGMSKETEKRNMERGVTIKGVLKTLDSLGRLVKKEDNEDVLREKLLDNSSTAGINFTEYKLSLEKCSIGAEEVLLMVLKHEAFDSKLGTITNETYYYLDHEFVPVIFLHGAGARGRNFEFSTPTR